MKQTLKKILLFITNPRFLLCWGIAWTVTNGWSYIMLAAGIYFDRPALQAIAGAYLTILWLPISPEKLVTALISMLLLNKLFPEDEKTLAVVKELYAKAKAALSRSLGLDRKGEDRVKTKKRAGPGALIALSLLLILTIFCVIYVNDDYEADQAAIAALVMDDGVTVSSLGEDLKLYEPQGEPVAGIIFYPGAKVDPEAYGPLMCALAQRGFTCILAEMPLDLAVLDIDLADRARELGPDLDRWYMAGHSLGGSMAAAYLKDRAGDYEGLILLAAYSVTDLSDSGLRVLSIYGTEDGVLDMVSYRSNWDKLPPDSRELEIQGGDHAGFGLYGPQDGDGISTISPQEQIEISAQAIHDFITET